ncbi:class I adenylate-forming enzyme family protein [Sphingobium sp. Sx8-8]|uniref:class I adenylate-forming enzyme family protein n=1 Tax=Sphingobium sp. Sx8-8 TaxID=2933617 RepID=UPI001F57B98D|nr:class I adenylate-forming enzyme family protein [Sphingobium sp. Sx8-8]
MQTHLLLEMAAEAIGDREGYTTVEGGLSYAEAFRRAKGGANFLSRFEGDKVVFLGHNGPAFPLALYAAGLAGRPFVPLNYRLADADLRKLVARTAPSVLIADGTMATRVHGVEGVRVVTREAFEAACVDDDNCCAELPFVDQDIAILLFTSGTTGDPKAAVLRHGNLTSYVISTVEFMGAGEDETALVSVPPYHIAGIAAVLTGTYSGRRIAYLHSFAPDAWVQLAHAERVTHAMVVPTMLSRILDAMELLKIELPHLRAVSYGGGRMPAAVIERAMQKLPNVDFVNAYGLTETSSTIAVLGPEDHRQAFASPDEKVRARLGSVGRPLPSLELEIRGPDGKTVLGPRESGEIYVRGEQVAGEYLHKKVLSDDGWFATNDAGWVDEDGYLFVEGRLDDVIVRGGENISPGEIEDVLRQHPSVVDVAVYGLPDDQWGEKVGCSIVCADPRPETAELAQWVQTRLRSTKTPESWDFRAELPYNETGKLLRRVLKVEMTKDIAA